MKSGIYGVIKRYEQDGIDFTDWYYKINDYYGIYNKMMELTDNDHEISEDGTSWCEIATIGDIYEFHEGEIEIVEID